MNTEYMLVGIDGSDISRSLVKYATWLATSNGLPIKILHTIEHTHQSEQAHHEGNLTPNIRRQLLKELSQEERLLSKQLIAKGKTLINAALQQVQSAGIKNSIAKLRHGTLPEAIVDLASETSLVMLGSKGKSHTAGERGLGYHLQESIRVTDAPVFIAKKAFITPQKIMFAYNGSSTSKRALNMITQDTIYKESMEIHVVSVNNDLELAQKLVSEAEQTLQASNNKIVVKALSGETIEQLTTYQRDNKIDITAMGAFSHGKVHGFFFGSFTTKMIQQSDTNFLLIR